MSPNLVQRLSAEALGTLLPVYFGAAATLAATAGALGTAIAYAVALALAVWAFGAVSGAHANPTVTIALAARGRFAWRDVPGYVIAQVVGGILAGLLAWATYGKAGVTRGLGGAVHLNPAATVLVGLVVEALAAFLLVLAYYALFVEERVSRGAAGLGVGLAYGTAILALAPITGASANFARTFGTDLSLAWGGGHAYWGDLWIYAVGPLVGGIVAVYVYDVLIAGRPLAAALTRRVTTRPAGSAAAHPA
jgi:glycerol uptake facilitator protein